MRAPAPCQPAGPVRPKLTLADVLNAALEAQPPRLSPHQRKIINTVRACRTPRLGGHLYRCEHCGREHFVPHACGNRHCPNCQGRQAVEWMERQIEVLLPVPYFHVVFTLPHALNPMIQQNQRRLYNLLFASASATLLDFGKNNLGVRLGLSLVLHTWSQTLLDHYHVHCIVTGGGLALDGSGWKASDPKFLFPVVALGQVFRGKFCEGLQRLYANGKLEFHGQLNGLDRTADFQAVVRQATAKPWNVYTKLPFAGPKQVLRYLSLYTHRVAIGNRRLLALDTAAATVRFSYQQRRPAGPAIRRNMDLDLSEFLRRYCLHILPERFVKIRHYGILSNRGRQERVSQIKTMLAPTSSPEDAEVLAAAQAFGDSERTGTASDQARWVCPFCRQPALVWVETFRKPVDVRWADQRAPP